MMTTGLGDGSNAELAQGSEMNTLVPEDGCCPEGDTPGDSACDYDDRQ